MKKFKPQFLVFFTLLCNCVYAQSKQDKPNVLFIIVDQLRYDALSIAGNQVVKTPNIDRIGRQGVYFKNHYTPMAVCAPARAALLTGRTVEHTGVVNNELADKPVPGVMPQQTYDEILTSAGYRAEYYGKFHSPEFHDKVYQNPEKLTSTGKPIFGHGMQPHYRDFLKKIPETPPHSEFMDSFSGRPYTPNPIDKSFNGGVAQGKKFIQPDFHGRLNIPDGYSITAMQGEETMEALGRLKNQPFSLTCSFHLPHAPMLPTAKYYQMYPPDKMKVPASIYDNMENSPYKKSNGRLDNPEYADSAKIKYMISDYYGLIKEVDDWVGKILNKLDELKLSDNTLIIFTADHGEMLGAHGLREKNVFYEESAHVPLLIRFPKKIKSNTVVSHYTTGVDLFASIFDYLGQPVQPSDGSSLRDLVEGNKTTRSAYIVTEWLYRGDSEPNYMIVKDGWKMFIPQTATSQVIDVLYNLKDDPYEINNLIGNNNNQQKYASKVNELKNDLLQWLLKHKSKNLDGVKQRMIVKN
jgi:arylsulfatase A-like enzyme